MLKLNFGNRKKFVPTRTFKFKFRMQGLSAYKDRQRHSELRQN